MENSRLDRYKKKLITSWRNLVQKFDEDDTDVEGRERVVVFTVSLVIAICLWLMVNLSLKYTITFSLPISLRAVPNQKALAEPLPAHAMVSVTGEGWKLLNLYNNPPTLNVDVNDNEVNLYDQAQQQFSAFTNIAIQKVQPLFLTPNLEKRASKKVPVVPKLSVEFNGQYNFIGHPSISPDSITVTGAGSLIDDIESWPTDSVHLDDVDKDINQKISLEQPEKLIHLSNTQVNYYASVAQFTEDEANVNIQVKGLPLGKNVTFNPPSLTVKFDVPITEYKRVKKKTPFKAVITYQQIQEDSTGYINPKVENSADSLHLHLRSIKPRSVAYFTIMNN